ncbi:MAG TPA: SEC-C metal-binding domain-containing protein, partial [Clostridiales bacterium]|nr:SEC-C metal-binding domain-containing protein [Clostridiales bacterium]
AMDDLKQGIYMRSYSQRDPVVEYRVEGFEMFDAMVALIREDTVRAILTVMPRPAAPMQRTQIAKPSEALHGEKMPKEKKAVTTVVNKGKKIGRNDPCPCGSGKKYKKCCGANEEGE